MSESSWFQKVFRKLEKEPAAQAPPAATAAAALETPWWEAADALAELADRAIEVPTAAEAALVARIDERLRAERYSLPVLPETLVEVLELANRSDASIREISEAVHRDAVVTGEVLALVNSAAYLPASPIRDLPRAVVHVGVRRVRHLLLAVAARITVLRGADVARGRQLWMHSLGTAVLARAIARAVASDPDEAFLAGLLHDIGKSVILGVVAEEERSSPAVVVPERLLRQLLDQCHTGAGLRIARTWRLGERLEQAIEQHHGLHPSSPPLVAVVALANDVCGSLGVGVPRRRASLAQHAAFPILGATEERAFALLEELPSVLEQSPEFRGVPFGKRTPVRAR